jgi:hypothetical protein
MWICAYVWQEMIPHFDCSSVSFHTCISHIVMQYHDLCVIWVNKHGFWIGHVVTVTILLYSDFSNLMYCVCKIYILLLFTSNCLYVYSFHSVWPLHQKLAKLKLLSIQEKQDILNPDDGTHNFPSKMSLNKSAFLCQLKRQGTLLSL